MQDLLRCLETGLQHKAAAVRSACYAFWHTPSVQCTLGRHLPGAALCYHTPWAPSAAWQASQLHILLLHAVPACTCCTGLPVVSAFQVYGQ